VRWCGSQKKVKSDIKSLKTRKAPGNRVDRITVEVIQAPGDNSVRMMHDQRCNELYEDKKCPKDWGKAIIVPLHKKNDRQECSNYPETTVYIRKISQQQRLKGYVNRIVAEEQAGFRVGRNTLSNICSEATVRKILCNKPHILGPVNHLGTEPGTHVNSA